MKRFLLIICAVIGIAVSASAQKAQFQIGYGGYTQMDCSDMHPWGDVNNAWGALTAAVNFKVAPKFMIGASYTFSSASYKHHDGNAFYHVLMLNARYDYWRNSIVKLYAHGALGSCITHAAVDDESKDKGYVAFQVSPLGAEVGIGRGAALFGELGYGAQGLVQVGFRFNM
ncbi:MAG: porin family protein [Duncaniella sp.]|nr:porin family protein [Duncaniella sp.]MDE6178526.1 porin family protein [Duncaniella sp.]MDE6391022.1 porin family protein [Duncaniella sp.]